MAKIELYLDESKGHQNSFVIHAIIWGAPHICSNYKNDIQGIVNKSSKILGPNFKEFHANRVNGRNWSTIGTIYVDVLKKFKEYIEKSELNLLIRLEAKDVYNNNAGFLKDIAKTSFSDSQHLLSQIFPTMSTSDHPAFYHSIDQLIVFLKYRSRFGSDGDEIDYFPDASGKILQYRATPVTLVGNNSILNTSFFDAIKIWGNSLTRMVDDLVKDNSWPKVNIRLSKYEPKDSSTDYMIQTCDIISNFSLNYIRFICGVADIDQKLKHNEINKLFNLKKYRSKVKKSFVIQNGELICINNDLKALFEFKIDDTTS